MRCQRIAPSKDLSRHADAQRQTAEIALPHDTSKATEYRLSYAITCAQSYLTTTIALKERVLDIMQIPAGATMYRKSIEGKGD